MKLKDILPTIYKNLDLGPWLDYEIEEKSATCENCLASRPERGKLPYYDANLKCCTYHPFVPNYFLGALLQNGSTPEFVSEILKVKEQNRRYLLPIGALPPVRYQVHFNNREKSDFGNRHDWLCPFYDKNKNQCGIWQYRGSTCSTYYCKSDYGKQGLKFWESLSELLYFFEIRLAEKALQQMGFTDDEIMSQFEYFDCTDGTEEEMNSDDLSPALWGHYWGNRNISVFDFYKKTYAIVMELRPEDLILDLNDKAYKKIENKLNNSYLKLPIATYEKNCPT